MNGPAIGRPRLTDKRDMQTYQNAVAGPLLQLLPIHSLAGRGKGYALDAAALDAFGDASIDIGMKAKIIRVNKQAGALK